MAFDPIQLLSAPSSLPTANVGSGGSGHKVDISTSSNAESGIGDNYATFNTGAFNFGGSSFNPVLIAAAVVAGLFLFMKGKK